MRDQPVPLLEPVSAERHLWRARREAMEALPYRHRWRSRMRRRVHKTAAVAKRLLDRNPRIRQRIERNLDIGVTHLELGFADLPAAFDGYRILHLTDLHLDTIDATAALAARMVAGIEADLCVITGDVRDNMHTPLDLVMDRLSHVLSSSYFHDGVLGILGNHDSAAMVEPMEALGIRMLINESLVLARGPERVHVTGLDDVHLYRTDAAAAALATAPEGFGIALVHSPEIAQLAAHRHRLYLCGHTHGGLFALGGRRPMVTRLKRNRRFARGLWHHRGMVGYTNCGIGASLVPSRFGTTGEMAVITLRRRSAP